jgi:tetratricopeptide (TPR) repeat protein
VRKLIERETTPFRQARAWADAAIGYHGKGDAERAVAVAKRCIEVMDRNDSAAMKRRRLSTDWRFEIAEILHVASEIELARRALRHAEETPFIGLDAVLVAAAWMRIEEDAQAKRLIKQHFSEIADQELDENEKAWARQRPWIIIAMAFTDRGEIEKAEKALANIPATSQNRMRGVRSVGNLLLERGDPESKRAACEFFTRHAPLAASAEKTPDDQPYGDMEEVVYCAQAAVRAGAIDAVETHFLPTMSDKERKRMLPFLATMSAGLSLDERIERYIRPLPDPADRVRFLGGNATWIHDDGELRKIERMILQEKDCAMSDPCCTLTRRAIHRQSLKHWDRARELFEQSLALMSEIEQTRQRAWQLQFFMVSAWLHGHSDLAEEAARQLIDVAWESRGRKIERWDGSVRGDYIREARQLLEVISRTGDRRGNGE